MKTVACVLKTGGWRNRHIRVEYGPDNVRWLRDQVVPHLGTAYRFVCLSDVPVAGVDTIQLQDNLPGWWSKIELFREFDDAFYLDLDTAIVGDITRMVKHKHRFTVLKNLSSREDERIGSGVMAWRGDYSVIYREFMACPERHMAECTTSEKWGDQGFIQSMRLHTDTFQALWPGRVVSYKLHGKDGYMPRNSRIVCYHGLPKPAQAPVKGFM